MKDTTICNNCGIVFEKRYKNSNRKYCSPKCYREAKLFQKKCPLCGKIFIASAPNLKYCLDCRTKTCEKCGKQFIMISREVDGNKNNVPKKYCSQECYHKATIGNPAHNKEEGINILCPICNKYFNVWKSRANKAKYCSWECFNEAKSRITGENHPLWKGGITLYGKLISENEGSFYRNRKIVLERDNYTCQYCEFKGKSDYMDVHHIIKVIEGGSNLLDNLITLCRKCHNNADRGYISIDELKEKVMILH